MQDVPFYFDFISPYAHIAWRALFGVTEPRGLTVTPIPVLFAGILNAHGQKGPAEIAPKRVYTFKDAFRKNARFGFPALRPPPSHPFNPLLALRAACSASGEAQRRLIDALFAATWLDGLGVEDEAQVARAADSAGINGTDLVQKAKSDEAKATLRANTEQAISRGVFGVPTWFAGDELFWGADAIPAFADLLDGKDPLSGEALSAWVDIPASADRLKRRDPKAR